MKNARPQPDDDPVADEPTGRSADVVFSCLRLGEAQFFVRHARCHLVLEDERVDPCFVGATCNDGPVADVLAERKVGTEDGSAERLVESRAG